MATAVEFRVGADDPLGYACGLLRAAAAKGARLIVRVEPGELGELDARLWNFSQLDFLPHVRVGDALQARTPIVLTDGDDVATAEPRDCLVNLAATPARGWEGLARVIEIVGADDAQRQAGRARFRAWRQAGCEPRAAEVGGAARAARRDGDNR